MTLKSFVIVILLASPSMIFAHPGNTASDGAHYCRTRCDYWGVPWNQRHSHGGGSSYRAPSSQTPILSLSLNRGSTGERVRKLQEVLAKDSSVYPEGLVTGNFGPITEQAVKRFQIKHGIDPVGQVGPITKAKIKVIFDIDL